MPLIREMARARGDTTGFICLITDGRNCSVRTARGTTHEAQTRPRRDSNSSGGDGADLMRQAHHEQRGVTDGISDIGHCEEHSAQTAGKATLHYTRTY